MIISKEQAGNAAKALQDLYNEYVASTPRKAASVLYNALPQQQQQNLKRSADVARHFGSSLMSTPAGAQLGVTGKLISGLERPVAMRNPETGKIILDPKTGNPIVATDEPVQIPDQIGPSKAVYLPAAWNDPMRLRALALEAEGKLPKDIYEATKLFRRYEPGGVQTGEWHKEVSDAGMRFKLGSVIKKQKNEILAEADVYRDAGALRTLIDRYNLKTLDEAEEMFHDKLGRYPQSGSRGLASHFTMDEIQADIQSLEKQYNAVGENLITTGGQAITHKALAAEDPYIIDKMVFQGKILDMHLDSTLRTAAN